MTSEKFSLDRNNLASNLRLWLQQHPQGGYFTLEGDNVLVVSDQLPGEADAPVITTPTLAMSQELVEQLKKALLGQNNGVRSGQQAYAKIGEAIGWSALNVSHVAMYGLTKFAVHEYTTLSAMLEKLVPSKQPEVTANGATEHEPDG